MQPKLASHCKYSFSRYDVTTIRAGTPMFLLARKIKVIARLESLVNRIDQNVSVSSLSRLDFMRSHTDRFHT